MEDLFKQVVALLKIVPEPVHEALHEKLFCGKPLVVDDELKAIILIGLLTVPEPAKVDFIAKVLAALVYNAVFYRIIKQHENN